MKYMYIYIYFIKQCRDTTNKRAVLTNRTLTVSQACGTSSPLWDVTQCSLTVRQRTTYQRYVTPQKSKGLIYTTEEA